MPHQECYKRGEINPKEGLQAGEWLNLSEIVASHYVDPECDDVKEFVRLADENRKNNRYAPKIHVLAPGDTHTW